MRRPLEAMSRTLPLVALFFIPMLIPYFGKHLYQWAHVPGRGPQQAMKQGRITREQAHPCNFKYRMLNRIALVVEFCCFLPCCSRFMFLLNKWSLQRDADPARGTERSFDVLADEVREPQRPRDAHLRHPAHFGCDRLGDVARPDLVLVDLGSAVPGGARLRSARARHPHGDSAFALRADEDAAACRPSSTISASSSSRSSC